MPKDRYPGWRRTGRLLALVVAAIGCALTAAMPVHAVNTQHSSVVSANPADWTPHMLDGTVYKFLQIGNRIYIGGSFTVVRNANSSTQYARRYLVAADKNTGRLDLSFAPVLDGAVRSLVAGPNGSIYAGGDFTNVGGGRSRSVVRIDAATGARLTSFVPPEIGGGVEDMRLVGNRLIVGGRFQTVAGATRRALVALNASTGALDPFLNTMVLAQPRVTNTGVTAPVKIMGLDVTPDGSRLVIIGNFNSVAGQPRYQLAVIDLTGTSATLNGWATDRYRPNCSDSTPTYTTGIDISGDGRWFVVVAKGYTYTGLLCDAATRWELTGNGGGQQPTWVNLTGGDTLLSVAITGAAVYVGGHQRWMDNPLGRNSAGPGAVSRNGIAALNPVSGRALSWNPGKSRGVGVEDIYATPEGLWIGSDTDQVAGEYHAKVAFFPL